MAIDIKFIEEKLKKIRDKKDKLLETLKSYDVNIEEIGNDKLKATSQFKLMCNNLKDIKIACVMDRFTLDSYLPECRLLEVTPNGWKLEIENFRPDMLFIESAWQGKDGLWYRKIANGSKEFFEMTSYCQEKNIPIVFWNKEDPVYTDVFMVVARMADVVFTTDIDCIKKYKDTLKHDNVYHLHFAAQPKIHNPIEKYNRKDKYCFAGAYYHRYKERAEVFDKFSEVFINDKGFDIYDRNYKSALPEHAFPSSYDKYILGKLDSSEIDVAYKGYNYGINMNSISQSQTMFARRVFEMLASNTVTIGNYSRGVKNYFGDLTICTNDKETLQNNIKSFCNDEAALRKYRLLGLRKVLQQHLYEDRLNYIVSKVFHKSLKKQMPKIIAVGYVNDLDEASSILRSFNKQKYENKVLYIVVKEEYLKDKIKDVNVINEEEAKKLMLDEFGNNNFIATLNPNDYYGANYFMDLALATRYGDFSGIGKSNCYIKNDNNEITIENTSHTYKYAKQLSCECSIIKINQVSGNSLYDFSFPKEIKLDNLFSIDEFNYCRNCAESICDVVDDLKVADQGISIFEIEKTAENINYDKLNNNGVSINADEIFKLSKVTGSNVKYNKNNGKLVIESTLGEDDHQYIYIEKLFEIREYENQGNLPIIFNGLGGLDLTGVCVFYDINKNKILPVFSNMNKLLSVRVPQNASFFKLGLRPKGKGKFIMDNISIGMDKDPNEKGCFISRSNVLILTNQYPSAKALYRNMFVHKRVLSYKEENLPFDVMRMNIYAKDEYSEFEGINIVEGQSEVLANILERGNIDTVCVHFLDSHMWGVLKNYTNKIRIIVWVHGAEIQPWWRREYNYNTKEELEKAKEESKIRLEFWSNVFKEANNCNIHFVFVSNYFANEVFKDNKIKLSQDKYSIIHNCIDTELFNYVEKTEEQRKKILSIRPYASNKYANDLTVKCILELSKKPYFNNLNFKIMGNGELFDSILKPIKKFKNVEIIKTFLRQDEIAGLHKEYGMFLTPTRMDSQGVSRDEAMSSGLVPITNSVTAIPEFVDERCGILADGEDYVAMANGIEKLYNEPELFLEMSKNAAHRVREQSSKEFTIMKEIDLIIN